MSDELLHIRIYIAGITDTLQARINKLQLLLADINIGRTKLSVIDIFEQPEQVEKDKVLITPTIIVDSGNTIKKFFYDFNEADKLLESLLTDSAKDFSYETRHRIKTKLDAATITLKAKQIANTIGFTTTQQHTICDCVSELANNIVRYAGSGDIELKRIYFGEKQGISIISEDQGPGIGNIDQAIEEHYSSEGNLGLGLSSIKRRMDDFSIDSQPGQGTRIIAIKWL